jgi:tripartite-type tricarboxylate transporter receptor subunit TctC
MLPNRRKDLFLKTNKIRPETLTMKTFRSYYRYLSALLAALVLSAPLVAHAQDAASYPNRPIKIIVPVAPGGTVDMVARSIAEALTKSLGQQVIVENKPGASSLVGTNFVAKAAPDGYTLLAHSTTFVTAPVLLKNAGYDPFKDFVPITVTCQIPMVLVVNPDKIAARNVKDFIALAKAQPKFYAYASSGNGSTGHIAAELFSSAAGVSYLHVPYKGNAQSMVDLLGGQIPFMFDQVSTSAQYILSGKIAAIGVTSKTRSAILPNVPTLDESGLKGFEDTTFNGLFAPAGTPAQIINRLHTELTKILQSPDLVKQFMAKGVELGASPTPEQFKQYLEQQTSRYRELARSANISAD